jgi:hypothetical protein
MRMCDTPIIPVLNLEVRAIALRYSTSLVNDTAASSVKGIRLLVSLCSYKEITKEQRMTDRVEFRPCLLNSSLCSVLGKGRGRTLKGCLFNLIRFN